MNETILEKAAVSDIVRHLPRTPVINRPADVEFVNFDPGGASFLAVTADSLCEEIATGLYSDPYVIGWVLVMAAASDLAAAGARAIGVTVSLGLPQSFGPTERDSLSRGIGDACRSIGTVTLGGDTSAARELTATAFAVGLAAKDRVMTRVGARVGDAVYLSARAGLGSAYALGRFAPHGDEDDFAFLPRARLRMGEMASRFASCAMDTSDGVVAALDELSRVNHTGFMVTADPASFLHPRALDACRRRAIPPWLALAGCHGEFELAFTVPASRERGFLAAARQKRFCPKRIGCVTAEPGVFLAWNGATNRIDSAWIRNLRVEGAQDARTYIERLVGYARTIDK